MNMKKRKEIRVLGLKGGIGKSSMSKNVAGWGVSNGFKTCLVDLDELASVYTWHKIAISKEEERIKQELQLSVEDRRMNYEFKKSKKLNKDATLIIPDFNPEVETDPLKRLPFKVFKNEIGDDEDYDLVVYDYPPRYNKDIGSGLILMPTLLDKETLLPTFDYYHDLEKDFYTLLFANKYDIKKARERRYLKEYFDGMGYVRDRACYDIAYGEGRTIYDDLPYSYLDDARGEFNQVMLDLLHKIKNANK
ncbi:AAA family ATPase [Buttiauxella gaviniae]|uniref:AAA family ATPase n=1 Tax=Buttiauxella gaviniae TaxID=82990 RepID=UPI0039B10224